MTDSLNLFNRKLAIIYSDDNYGRVLYESLTLKKKRIKFIGYNYNRR